MTEESIKLGFLKAGECVNINLMYFVPSVDFDLYSRASLFKWHRPSANWGEFATQLVADGFGSVYSHIDIKDITDPVGLYSGEEGKYVLVKGPFPITECEDILKADSLPDSRVFQLDRQAPTRMGINRLLEHSTAITEYLTTQYIAYLAAMVQDSKTEPEFGELIKAWSEDPSREKALEIGKIAEGRYAMKRTRRLVEDGGYSISGFSGEKDGEPNILYSVGLAQNGPGYEIFCREKIRIEIMSTIINYAGRLAFEKHDIETVNAELAKFDDLKKYRPRLVLCRNEKIDKIFTYRLSDKFEVYRLMLDNK